VRDSAVVTEGDGGGRLAQGIVSDITERKALTEQFLRLQKLESVGRLAGGVAHSFNNSLTTIYGRCELVLDRLGATDASRKDVERILAVAQGAARITRQLLAVGRQERSLATILDPADVIGSATALARRVIGEHIEFAIDLEADLARVKVDRALFEQVLLNLFLNARDAMSSGGVIAVRASTVRLDEEQLRSHQGLKPGRHVRIDVSDTGNGVAPEVWPTSLSRSSRPRTSERARRSGWRWCMGA